MSDKDSNMEQNPQYSILFDKLAYQLKKKESHTHFGLEENQISRTSLSRRVKSFVQPSYQKVFKS